MEKSTLKQRPPVYNLVSQLLLWDQSLSRFIQYATFIFSNIQCVFILLAYQLGFIANSNQDLFSDYLSKLCKMLSLIDIVDFEKRETAIKIILGAGALYVLTFLTPFLLSLKRFWVDQQFSQGKNAFCVYFGLTHCGLGFWTLNAFTMSYLKLGFNGGEAVIAFGCIVLIAVNYLMAFYFSVYSYDPFIGSNVLSCHSRILQIILFGFKAVAAPIIFLTDNSSKSTNWTFVILSMVILGTGHFELMRGFPYYNYTTMKIAIILSTCKIWIALMNLIALTEASQYLLSGKVLVYIEAPICSLAIRMMLDIFHRMIFSSFASSQDRKSISKIMRKIFGVLYLIERTKPTYAAGNKRSVNEINFFGALVAKDNQKYLIRGSMNKNEEMAPILRGILEDAIEKFNTNQQLQMIRAGLMLNNSPFEVSMMSLGELKKLQGGGGARLVTIKMYQKLQERMTSFFEESRDTILDLNQLLEYETASVNLNNSIQNGIKHYKNYWSLFLNPNLKIQKFFLKSKELEKIVEDIERQWKKSVENNKHFAGVFCNVYGLFLHLLRASPFHAQVIQQKYSQVGVFNNVKFENEEFFTNESLFGPNILMIHASLTKENPGKILSLSLNFEELTGWRVVDILDHNVNILMPPFMAFSHNKLLLNHLKKLQIGQTSSKMYKTLRSYIMHKGGYMLACDIYLSLNPIVQDSPVYIAFVKVKAEANEQILLNEEGIIEGFTRKIGNLLDLKMKTKNHYDTICANFPDVQVALEKLKQDEPQHCISLEEGIHFRRPQWRNTIQYSVDISCHVFDNKLYFSLSLDFDESYVIQQHDPEEFSERMTPQSPQIFPSPTSNLKPLKFDFRKTEVEDGEKNLLCSSDRNLLVKTRKDDQIKEVELKDIQSSIGSFSKHSVTKFEKALNTMPKNPRVCLLYLSFIFLMMISGLSLIIFQQKVSTTLDQIHSSGEVISNLIFRLVRYTDVYAYARILWQANVGLTELDRYDQYGYTINTMNYNVDVMAGVLENIRERNEGIRSFVYRLDEKLSNQIYSDLVPVYEIQPNGGITQTREDNLFDLTTELVATGTEFLYSGMAFDENNPYMIFLLNNTMNEPLLAGQRELPILMDDNESKLNDLSIYTYMMIGVTFGVAIAIFIYFKNLVMKFIKERGQFIFVFTNIDEKHVHEHLRLLENFQAIFHKTSNSKAHLIETQPGSKKIVDNKGINRTLYLIYLALIIFLLGICSVSPIISILAKKSSNTILKKLNLMTQSNYIFYNLVYYWNIVNAYAQYGVYEYEYIKGKPLVEAIKGAAEGVLGVQDFFINDLLDPENGMSDNSFLYNTAVGDLCDLYSFSDEILEKICPTLGGGAATKGIIGLHAYHIIALNAMEQCYTQSLKTWEDSKRCLSLQEIVNIEVFYPYTYNSFNNIDILIRAAMVKDYDQMNGFISGFLIAYLVLYVVGGTLVGWRIKQKLEEEMTDWRKMIRQIPFAIGNESKLMKPFLQKYRKDI